MSQSPREIDAVVVGAGFAGLYMIHRLRGLDFSVQAFEVGDGVGGTWYWNRYPGARCDIESMEYSYQFSEELQQEWVWTERYAAQPEILSYANHVADRFNLRGHIQFETRVESAIFDEEMGRWQLRTNRGDQLSARFCIMATGCLSCANTPDFPGLDSFEGEWFHTGRWPHDGVDFSGKRVGVIGTGSSAIQSVPIIAEQAAQLTVFQRTPNYSVPAHNAPLDESEQARVKADYPAFRARNATMPFGAFADMGEIGGSALEASEDERQERYDLWWAKGGLPFLASFGDLLLDESANATAAAYVRDKIRGILDDPTTAEALLPDQTIGCKRMCVDTGYYATFNKPSVSLVDLRESAIEAITPTGLRTASSEGSTGAEYEFDAIVFATGFDAMTGALLSIDIRGVNGRALADKWSAGPRTYLGLGTSGFPNLFTVTGPGSPSVLANMIPAIEQQVNWITDCLEYMRERGLERIEAELPAEDAWVAHVNEVADATVYPRCNSWYVGANVPGKPRVFMPYIGFPTYVAKCDEVSSKGYEGFALA